MSYSDALRILNLNNEYTEEQLKKNYRNLMKKYHPDLHIQEDNQGKLFLEKKARDINEAYELLAKNLKNRSNNPKDSWNYEASIEKRKTEIINTLNKQLKELRNFLDSDDFIYIEEEISFINEAINDLKNCKTDLDIFKVTHNLKDKIEKNNFDLFDNFINNWQIDRFTQNVLSKIYPNYRKNLKNTKSIIGAMELIEKLKQDCYDKADEYKNEIKRQIRKKLDSYIAEYYNDELYSLIGDRVEKLKQTIEYKICDIYFADDYEDKKDYFDKIVIEIYHQFEQDLLKLVRTTAVRKQKIFKLRDCFLNDYKFEQFLRSKENYLYANILNSNFDELYEKTTNEVNTLYRQLKIEKMNLNKIKNSLAQNYSLSVERLDILKDSEQINLMTELYQQALKFLMNVSDKDISLDWVTQLLNVDFIDLAYTKKTITDIIFYSISNNCDIYIKRKKSGINGNVVKVRNFDELVDYDYIVERLNCSFSNTLSLNEFNENYISLQQFLQRAVYIGKYARATRFLLGSVKGIALYATTDNVLFLDPNQNKFKFVINKDNISYFDEVNVGFELKNKVEVYKMLMEQYALTFDDTEFTKPKTKKLFNLKVIRY